MEFRDTSVFSAVNADLLVVGDLVYFADTIAELKYIVASKDVEARPIKDVLPETEQKRFKVANRSCAYAFVYLVCTAVNAKAYAAWKSGKPVEVYNSRTQSWVEAKPCDFSFIDDLYRPKEQKLRKFNGTAELLDFWNKKQLAFRTADTIPLIWVRNKDTGLVSLITAFDETAVHFNNLILPMATLLLHYEFLDGTPCGLED